MGFGLTLVLMTLIIAVAVLTGIYMLYCAEKDIKMFENPRYNERIIKLERVVKQLEDKI